MAHDETVFVDQRERFTIDRNVCAESLHGDWCEECEGRGHYWFVVTRILPDGFGEIQSFGPDERGYWHDSFDTEEEALAAARSLWPERPLLKAANPPRIHEIAYHYGRTSRDVLWWMHLNGWMGVKSASSRPPLAAVLAYIGTHRAYSPRY